MPLRPAGTHAYVISPAGARKLLAGCPRANYHVDVAAWGLRALQLFCVNPLLAKQTHADTTIGGNQDFAWISSRTGPLVFDRYTGADLAWAYNTPLLRLGGDSWFVLLSTGRIFSVYLLGLLASFLPRANTRLCKLLFALDHLMLLFLAALTRLLLHFNRSHPNPKPNPNRNPGPSPSPSPPPSPNPHPPPPALQQDARSTQTRTPTPTPTLVLAPALALALARARARAYTNPDRTRTRTPIPTPTLC